MTENLIEARNKIIVAVDVPTVEEALKLIEDLRECVGYFKVGLQLIIHLALRGWTASLAEQIMVAKFFDLLKGRLFLDGKFMDIPNTVALTSKEIATMGVKMFNIHCFGGSEMMKAAKQTVVEVCGDGKRPIILGVTLLTSLDYENLVEMGICNGLDITGEGKKEIEQAHIEHLVVNLAQLSQECGLDGVIASPKEIKAIRKCCEPGFLIITPGVRSEKAAVGDQKRVMTPREAIKAGADYLVIGREITQPQRETSVEAAKRIAEDIAKAISEMEKEE